jgi:hypothetical protein
MRPAPPTRNGRRPEREGAVRPVRAAQAVAWVRQPSAYDVRAILE